MVVVGCTDLRQRRFQVNLLLRRCRHTYLWRKSQMYARTEAWLMMLMSMVQTPFSLQGFISKIVTSCFVDFVILHLFYLISVFVFSVSEHKWTKVRSQTTMSHCCNSVSDHVAASPSFWTQEKYQKTAFTQTTQRDHQDIITKRNTFCLYAPPWN